MADDAQEMLEVGGETFSLADLAGIDTSQIEARKGSHFPASAVTFKCEDAKLTVLGSGVDKAAAVAFNFVCTNVIEVADKSVNAESLVGKHLFENVPIIGGAGGRWDVQEQIGYIKGFLADTGFQGSGSLQDLLAAFQGTEFNAKVKNRPNKDDPDIIYSSLGITFGNWKVSRAGETLGKKAA